MPHLLFDIFFANGDRYEGEWRNGKRHGYGVYTTATGIEIAGNWKDNRPSDSRGTTLASR